MQITDTTLSPGLDLVKSSWNFLEVWIDPMQSPPYLLLLLGDKTGSCYVCDPAANYRVVLTSSNYEEAQLWLLEDEYEPLEGRLSAHDVQEGT